MSLPVNAEPLPSSYTFGKVVGRVIHLIADTAEDTDDKPQARAAAGRVIFAPKEVRRKTVESDYPAIVLHASQTANLSSSGRVLDAEGRSGIWLATGRYSVTFDIANTGGNAIPPFDINVTAEHTDEAPLDLAKEAPYVAPVGTSVQTVVVPSGGTAGQVLSRDASGGLKWANPGLDEATARAAFAHMENGVLVIGGQPVGGGTGTTDPEIVRDAIGGALVGGANVQITVNDAGDTITISTTATANATDAQLRDRATHTGTQASATLSDLTETVQDIVAAFIAPGAGLTKTYDDAGNVLTLTATGGTGTTDPEVVRDTIGSALVAGSGITVTLNDAGDTITIASTAVLPTRSISTTAPLSGGGDLSANRTLAVSTATATAVGVVELATTAETTAGTDTTRAVTPAGVKAALDARPAGLASGGILRAIWNGTAYVDRSDGTTITSATDRPTGTYFSFLGGPDPNALGLMVDGDEWKDAV